jgi:hypothetical protein
VRESGCGGLALSARLYGLVDPRLLGVLRRQPGVLQAEANVRRAIVGAPRADDIRVV